jgi:hypothetical protein
MSSPALAGQHPDNAGRRGGWLGLLCVLAFILPMAGRFYVYWLPTFLNPDEAQFTVLAGQALDDPVTWRAIDLNTSGPLNALVISWPEFLGWHPDLLTSRLTGYFLQGLSFLWIALTIRETRRSGPSVLGLVGGVLYLSFCAADDFVHYNSESLPCFLICSYCALFARNRDHGGSGLTWAVAGFCASCLPIAKLQAVPFCLLFHLMSALALLPDALRRGGKWRFVTTYVIGAAIPVIAFVIPPFLVGEGDAITIGYLGLGAAFLGERGLSIIAPVLLITGFFVFLLGLALAPLASRWPRRSVRWETLFLGLALWPTAFIAIWLPGRTHWHYVVFAVYCMVFSVVLAQRAITIARDESRFSVFATKLAVLALAMILPFSVFPMAWISRVENAWNIQQYLPPEPNASSRSLLAWTGVKSRDRFLVWGWEPQLILYADLKSFDRASEAEYLIRPNPGRQYFRDRLMRELSRARPELILDAMYPGYFLWGSPLLYGEDGGLSSFPALNAIVRSEYELVAGGRTCAALFLRNDLVNAWKSHEIPLLGSEAALVDGCSTEDASDWWSPEDPHATAILRPRQPETIGELWIMSSNGGFADQRGTTQATVRLIAQSGEVSAFSPRLHAYPEWTVVPVNGAKPIARIEVESIRWVGLGPALSEIRAFRPTSVTRPPD